MDLIIPGLSMYITEIVSFFSNTKKVCTEIIFAVYNNIKLVCTIYVNHIIAADKILIYNIISVNSLKKHNKYDKEY